MKPLIFFCSLTILLAGACKPAAPDHEQADANYILKGTIDVNTAKRLVNNFEERSHHRPQHQLGDTPGDSVSDPLADTLDDTRCVWFSLKQLKGFIAKIDSDNVNNPGIRFYFAAYDRSSHHKDIKTKYDYLCHSTLVMVSTRDSIRLDDKGDTTRLHFDYYNDIRQNRMRGGILTAVPENQGELCPPPTPCGPAEGVSLLEP